MPSNLNRSDPRRPWETQGGRVSNLTPFLSRFALCTLHSALCSMGYAQFAARIKPLIFSLWTLSSRAKSFFRILSWNHIILVKLLNSHAKTPRRKEIYRNLSDFAALREAIITYPRFCNYFDDTLHPTRPYLHSHTACDNFLNCFTEYLLLIFRVTTTHILRRYSFYVNLYPNRKA